jgi:hypothetical protein
VEAIANRNVERNIKERAKKNVEKNRTVELEVGDYVRVKLSQLYSQIRKMVKDNDKKYIVVKYSPEIYIIDKILKPDNEGYEKLRYTLKTLEGEPVLTQQKMNNPNKPRGQKRVFASDLIKIQKEDIDKNITYDGENYLQRDGFNIHDALKLNVVNDAETEAKKIKKPKKPVVRIKKEPIPIEPREKSSRIRRPNSLLKGYAEINEDGEIMKELGGAIIGGKMYLFKA